MTKKVLVSALFLLLSFFNGNTSEINAAFGISPADISIDHLRPGGHYEKRFLLSRDDVAQKLDIVVEADIEGANSWIKVEPSFSFSMPEGEQSREMKVIIDVPNEAPYKEYNGFVTVKTKTPVASQGVSVVQGVGIAVNLITTDLTVSKLLVRELRIPEVSEDSPIKLIAKTENQGNVDITLEKAVIKIASLDGAGLFESEFAAFEKVKPTEIKELEATFDHRLKEGEYVANVSVIYDGKTVREEKLIFRVIPKESLVTADTNGLMSLVKKIAPVLAAAVGTAGGAAITFYFLGKKYR